MDSLRVAFGRVCARAVDDRAVASQALCCEERSLVSQWAEEVLRPVQFMSFYVTSGDDWWILILSVGAAAVSAAGHAGEWM